MFNPANQTHFSLSLDGLRHDLQVLEFSGHEGISRPYRFELELVSERAGLDLEALMHRPAFLAFTPQGQGVHGLVYGAAQADAGKRLTRYRLTLVPQLAYLAQRSNQRIFQHLTVPQIVALILEEHGILADAYRFQLGTRYPEREYCVQYDESDLHFVQRLCAEEGIHFHFRHSAEAHLLVFGDDQTVFPRLGRPTAYVHDSGLVADEPVIKRFSLRLASRTTRTTRRDYDFEKPRLLLEAGNRPAADAPAEPDLEDYAERKRAAWHEHAERLARLVLDILKLWHGLQKRFKGKVELAMTVPLNDVKGQLANLVYPGFVRATPLEWLKEYPRYLKAIEQRLDKVAGQVQRDRVWSGELGELWAQYQARLAKHAQEGKRDAELQVYRWMLEEYRVSLFAQQLGTRLPVSDKRLAKQWSQVEG
ncbi:hypothetical protein M770_22210 [Pseudomonas aeruginosa VRFPA03]|nr:hypothetical protein M770_22210 [Pseudomonas aeruginosa VRFPA03]